MSKIVVGGYVFSNSSETARAQKEYDNIQKLKHKIDINDMEGVRELYVKLTQKQYFTTPVGLGFLHEMREFLTEQLGDYSLPPISVPAPKSGKKDDIFLESKYQKLGEDYNHLVVLKKKLIVIIVALVVLIAGMFIIVVTNENLGYFNAEEKVLNKYSAWEEELSIWEQELIEREEELGINFNKE